MRAATAVAWGATLLYPLAIWIGLTRFEPRYLAVLLAALALLRAAVSRDRIWLLAAAGALVLVAASWFGNDGRPLKLYPVLVNAVLLVVFASSLHRPPSMIERIARLREPALPDAARPYLARLTRVWCGFFVLNGAIAAWTALAASDATWALYNGVIAYLLIGALLLGERVVRPDHGG